MCSPEYPRNQGQLRSRRRAVDTLRLQPSNYRTVMPAEASTSVN